MELTREQINKNWEEFKELLRSTEREQIESLISYLDEKTDFKVAPASTKYHGSFEGGLCAHSLGVYKHLKNLVEESSNTFSDDTLKIIGLLHDISKVNLYERTIINKKVYTKNGSKHDEIGLFDWVSVPAYKTVEAKDKFIYSNHESTSEFIVRQFISLHIEESVAILHHHGGLGWDSISKDAMSDIYVRYPLTMYLHFADMLAAFEDQI